MKIIFLHLLLLLMSTGKRALFIFYSQDGTAIKNRQLAELQKDGNGVQERDMAVYTFHTDTAKAMVKNWDIDVTKKFTIILVGKDGGEKLRSDTFLSTTKLFAVIDAMPMRKLEIQHK